MPTVKKRDNMKERFSDRKIKKSIIAAATEVSIPLERSKKIAEEITNKIIKRANEENELTSGVIRGDVLRELDKVEPTISRAWRKHDMEIKKRSSIH